MVWRGRRAGGRCDARGGGGTRGGQCGRCGMRGERVEGDAGTGVHTMCERAGRTERRGREEGAGKEEGHEP